MDLTPFGYTPTETVAYARLLDLGPSSGYAVAKEIGLARANAYAALDGLVAKGAAVLEEVTPRLYRAVAPTALLARISAQEAAKLDRLESEVAAVGSVGAAATTPFSGDRELREIVLRTVVREPGEIVFIGPPAALSALLPVWRKREADRVPSHLFAVGPKPRGFPIPLAGTVDPADLRQASSNIVLLLTGHAALAGSGSGTALAGFWTCDPLLVGLLRAAAEQITRRQK